jgi:hypothetical protein
MAASRPWLLHNISAVVQRYPKFARQTHRVTDPGDRDAPQLLTHLGPISVTRLILIRLEA